MRETRDQKIGPSHKPPLDGGIWATCVATLLVFAAFAYLTFLVLNVGDYVRWLGSLFTG